MDTTIHVNVARLICMSVAGVTVASAIEYIFALWLTRDWPNKKILYWASMWFAITVAELAFCVMVANSKRLTWDSDWTTYGVMLGLLSIAVLFAAIRAHFLKRAGDRPQ